MSWVLLIMTILILGFVALRHPRWAVVLLAIAVALEFVGQFYPQLGGTESGTSLLTLARLASAGVIAAALCRFIQQIRQRNRPLALARLRMIFVSPLMAVVLGLWLYGVIGLVYSEDVSATLFELLRWGMLLAVAVSAAYVLEKEDIPLVFSAVHITGLVLAPLALAEKLFEKNLFWQEVLVTTGEDLVTAGSERIHTTFLDANIFARYVVLAIVANLVLQRFCTNRRQRALYWLALLVLLAELVLTESRGGLLSLLAVLVLVLILLPQRKQTALLLAGIAAGGIILLWERLMDIGAIFSSGDSQRVYLIKVALAIFGDHPVFGTGLGTFQSVFVNQYPHYMTFYDGVTRSHTAVLTTAAEQGVIGLLFLAALIAVLIYLVFVLYKKYSARIDLTRQDNPYILGVGCFLWVAAIFVSSQAEGRFFEEPVFWVAAAMLLVLRRESLLA